MVLEFRLDWCSGHDSSSSLLLPLSFTLQLLGNTFPGASCWVYNFLTDSQVPESIGSQVSIQSQIHQRAIGDNYQRKRRVPLPFLMPDEEAQTYVCGLLWGLLRNNSHFASLARTFLSVPSILSSVCLLVALVSLPINCLLKKIIWLSVLLKSQTWDLLDR